MRLKLNELRSLIVEIMTDMNDEDLEAIRERYPDPQDAWNEISGEIRYYGKEVKGSNTSERYFEIKKFECSSEGGNHVSIITAKITADSDFTYFSHGPVETTENFSFVKNKEIAFLKLLKYYDEEVAKCRGNKMRENIYSDRVHWNSIWLDAEDQVKTEFKPDSRD